MLGTWQPTNYLRPVACITTVYCPADFKGIAQSCTGPAFGKKYRTVAAARGHEVNMFSEKLAGFHWERWLGEYHKFALEN